MEIAHFASRGFESSYNRLKLILIRCAGVKLLKNTGLPNNSQTASPAMVDEIPEAVRDISPVLEDSPSVSQSKRQWRFWLMLGLGILTFALTLWLNYYYQFGLFASQSFETSVPQSPISSTSNPSAAVSSTATAAQETGLEATSTAAQGADNLLGHLPYEEATQDNLKKITADGQIKLQPTAAEAFLKMSDAARTQGIHLVPISGFRTLEDQEYLFFGIKAQRGQDPTTRAEVSAPPGYSEHHTGYAIDIGDRGSAETHLTVSFEQTKAFQWLAENAAFYSFELSFPKGNPQGVSYEPWHWRYVGDRDSLETFYKAPSTTRISESPSSEPN
jgi:D-alanyl-D-alanine carboxypeptidase